LRGAPGGVYLTTDNGKSWTQIDNGLNCLYILALAACPDSSSTTNLFAATTEGVYRSTDDGNSWNAASVGLTSPYVHDLVVNPIGAGKTNLFAGTDSGVFVSTNYGTSWTSASAGLAGSSVFKLGLRLQGVSGPNLFAATDSGLFCSTNNGTHWSGANSGLENAVVDAFAFSGTDCFAGTVGRGVFLSTNNGTNWTAVNGGLRDSVVLSLAVSGPNLVAGTSEGVWRRPLSGLWTSVKEPVIDKPVACELSQNYPNPFNPVTTIGYTIAGTGHEALGTSSVRLSVYDMLGREVAVLVDERKEPGSYSVTFDASGLASGVYFYRIRAGDFVQTRKSVLLH